MYMYVDIKVNFNSLLNSHAVLTLELFAKNSLRSGRLSVILCIWLAGRSPAMGTS